MTTSTTPEFIEQGEVPAALAVEKAVALGAPLGQISMSSDGNASLPLFENNKLTGIEVGRVSSLFKSFVQLAELIGFEDALTTVTCNPANALGLTNKGQLKSQFDVDAVLLDGDVIEYVWAKGVTMVALGEAIKLGQFEA